jgi:hypothetical protein
MQDDQQRLEQIEILLQQAHTPVRHFIPSLEPDSMLGHW